MKGYFRKDDDGHYYFIPETYSKTFDQLMGRIDEAKEYSDEWYSYIDKFEENFDQYRLSGGIYGLLVEISDEQLE